MFVRNGEGMARLSRQIESGLAGNVLEQLQAIQKRYRLKCPKCGREFWLDPTQVETSWFDGEFQGFKCPEKGCKGIAKVGE
jgi:phage terminase large subunit GpA-like protein